MVNKENLIEIIVFLNAVQYNLYFNDSLTKEIIDKLLKIVEQNVFKIESVCLLELIVELNNELIIRIVDYKCIIPKMIEMIMSLNQGKNQAFYVLGLIQAINKYVKISENE